MASPATTADGNNKNELRSSASPDPVRLQAINEIFNRHKRDAGKSSNNETIPLVSSSTTNKPPLARMDTELEDDDDGNTEVVSKPYPGVDDGFFTPSTDSTNNKPEEEGPADPDVEMVPKDDSPPEIEPMGGDDGDDEIPEINPRAGPEGGSDPDESDGARRPISPGVNNNKPQNYPGRFPYAPGFGTDVENGTLPDLESIPDVNVYQHKKTLAQGMMDLALFSANANQLRYVLESYERHPYFYPSVILISISLIFQVAVGIGLIWNATYNVKDEKEICIANKISNFTIIGIFLVTVVNVFISAFGVANPVAKV